MPSGEEIDKVSTLHRERLRFFEAFVTFGYGSVLHGMRLHLTPHFAACAFRPLTARA
jgi:hypothetical protein